ncbi:MAG: dihydroorotase [Firmicutes bacterium]|nr:dihydroorotase [Bacillota bacterium]
MTLILRGGTVVDPVDGTRTKADVVVEDERVVAIGDVHGVCADVIDVKSRLIFPGFIDLHVHLREPGQTHKETIESGTRAAAAGGFTQICCMPNTSPVTDDPEIVRAVRLRAQAAGFATVHPIAAATIGSSGEQLTDFAALAAAGAVAFSDDGRGIQSAAVMRAALRAAGEVRRPICVHAEVDELSEHGVVNDRIAARLGVAGWDAVAETAMIARDIALAAATHAHVHMCHVSPRDAVWMIAAAKAQGVSITAEVTPHHLLLTDDAVLAQGARAKVNPPLRSADDREACVRGLLSGVFDAVATDHAPHAAADKDVPLAQAAFGFSGLETCAALIYTAFVETGALTTLDMARVLALGPARAFHLTGGRVTVGGVADLTVIDPFERRTVNPSQFYSKGRSTPFAGVQLAGWPVLTLHRGRIVHRTIRGEETN